MKPKIANSWRFLLRFIVFFALAYIIWDFTAPLGAKILGGVAGVLVKAVDNHDFIIDVKGAGKNIVVVQQKAKDIQPLSLEYKGFTFNTVLLVALIMAVPDLKYKLRAKILFLGIIILFPVQVFRLFVFIINYYKNIKMTGTDYIFTGFMRNTFGYIDKVLIRIDGQILPVVVWAALLYYYKWYNTLAKLKKKKTLPVAAQ